MSFTETTFIGIGLLTTNMTTRVEPDADAASVLPRGLSPVRDPDGLQGKPRGRAFEEIPVDEL